jgi:hypothetical protein
MEEVWLQSRKRSETEERCLAQLQWLQTDVAQALRVGELQKIYADAKESLSERAKNVLEPLEELSSKIIFSRADLRRVLKQWEKLHGHIQELRARETETARRWLDEMHETLAHVRIGDRLHDWQESYSHLRGSLPPRFQIHWLRFDAINNRVFYSRQELQRVWTQTMTDLRRMNLAQIRPLKFTSAVVKDFILTTRFAFTLREVSRH